MLNPAAAARRAIPSLDRLLQLGAVAELIARHGRPLVTEAARAASSLSSRSTEGIARRAAAAGFSMAAGIRDAARSNMGSA